MDAFVVASMSLFSVASRKLGTLLTKVASNKHFQRFAALKPVAGVIEKLSNAEVGVNVELMNFSGIMTVRSTLTCTLLVNTLSLSLSLPRSTFPRRLAIASGTVSPSPRSPLKRVSTSGLASPKCPT